MLAASQALPAPSEVAAVIGAILPIIIAFATHVGAGDRVRGIIATVLGVLAGPVATWLATNEAIISRFTASNAILAFIVSLATYFTTWKPIFNINEKLAPNFGIGKPKAA